MRLNKYRDESHKNNEKWWIDLHTGERIARDKAELIALIHSEVSEALEGERKNLMDDKLPHRRMGEVELADALIRIFDFAGGFNYDIDLAFLYFNMPSANDLNGYRDLFHFAEEDHVTNKGRGLARIHYFVSMLYEADFNEYNDMPLRIADVLSEIFAYAYCHNLDLEGAYREKTAYNLTRKDHSIEHRKSENGKKF